MEAIINLIKSDKIKSSSRRSLTLKSHRVNQLWSQPWVCKYKPPAPDFSLQPAIFPPSSSTRLQSVTSLWTRLVFLVKKKKKRILLFDKKVYLCSDFTSVMLSGSWNNNLSLPVAKTSTLCGCYFDGQCCPEELRCSLCSHVGSCQLSRLTGPIPKLLARINPFLTEI